MEDTLRETQKLKTLIRQRLNPCFNGRYSQSNRILYYKKIHTVLILVLMEDTLRELIL